MYHPAANDELVEAARFYDSRVAGLGSDFLDEFDQAVGRIAESPERYAIVRGTIRRCVLTRFPYGIYFRVANRELRILVVRHHSRHPDYGLDRG
ncbi:MAG: type II toxin-antitoxin system RelE/ParE family toxin [Pirellulaceae bacterium]|nr:type II toxin-antitoxin system RelE/ParE family toxin [Pirellulaceae bacterium]